MLSAWSVRRSSRRRSDFVVGALVASLVASVCLSGSPSTARAQGYTLIIKTLGSGSVSAGPGGPYAADTLVTLNAIPASGWGFSSWSGNLTGYANAATMIITGDSSVTATFDQTGYHGVTGDARTLTEPSFPTVCTVLAAQQSSSNLDQTTFDTAALQTAINTCPSGQDVELSSADASDAFLIQPIVLQAGVTLLIDADVTLFGSQNPADYNCSGACTPLIQVAANAAPNPGSAIMGYGIIDGQGAAFWGSEPRPRLIYAGNPSGHASADNFTLYKITLQNAAQFNFYGISNGLTVWGVKVRNPGSAPNTDGIDPSGSINVTIRDSFISTGDDHIAIKGGVGHVSNVTISHNHLYNGHGLSIGSETNAGVDNVLATDNVIDQAGCAGCRSSNDIRIKSDRSRGGEVRNVLYQDTCIRNATPQSHESVFDPFYSNVSGSLIPYFHDISLHNVHMLDAGGVSTFKGYDAAHMLTMSMDNVVWDGFHANDFTSAFTSDAAFTLGPGPVSFAPTLIDRATADVNVTVTNNISASSPAYDCTGRLVYLAGELFAASPQVDPASPVTFIAVLQPAIFGASEPTGSIAILDGATVIGGADITGRITSITVPSVSPGAHTYTARYSGDATYAALYFGSVNISTTTSAVGGRVRIARPSPAAGNYV
jgi:polygalacturonase